MLVSVALLLLLLLIIIIIIIIQIEFNSSVLLTWSIAMWTTIVECGKQEGKLRVHCGLVTLFFECIEMSYTCYVIMIHLFREFLQETPAVSDLSPTNLLADAKFNWCMFNFYTFQQCRLKPLESAQRQGANDNGKAEAGKASQHHFGPKTTCGYEKPRRLHKVGMIPLDWHAKNQTISG